MEKIKTKLTNEICNFRQYKKVYNWIKNNYSKDKVIDDNYIVDDLLKDIKSQSRSESLKIDLSSIDTENDQDPRWSVLTLEFSNIIEDTDNLESAADIIEERYIRVASCDRIKVVSSADGYTASDVVDGLRSIGDEHEFFNTITSSCGMRKHAKKTYNSESHNRDSDSSQQNRSSSSNRNSVDKDNKENNRKPSRIYNDRILKYINRRYEHIKKENKKPVVHDFKDKIQELVDKHGGDTIIYKHKDDDKKYTLGWLNKKLKDIIEYSSAPDEQKTKLNDTENWRRLKQHITSTANLREKVGKLYVDKTSPESVESDQTNNFI